MVISRRKWSSHGGRGAGPPSRARRVVVERPLPCLARRRQWIRLRLRRQVRGQPKSRSKARCQRLFPKTACSSTTRTNPRPAGSHRGGGFPIAGQPPPAQSSAISAPNGERGVPGIPDACKRAGVGERRRVGSEERSGGGLDRVRLPGHRLCGDASGQGQPAGKDDCQCCCAPSIRNAVAHTVLL